ncbi:MAG TPA: phytoene/squalene synthase family protein [Aliidongia sp.]|uniref:phytoene/squalene synthase family protein n=1 Tax=Aliidongia sp. TaxID=1914230 RepID=UPI002DDCABF6|nr:phytoene/squalene synthase family protein [Aliidongia sp.]HEV2673207.1 phytoene/squalene synthase family protein [Aliidongia sp.]
MPPRSPEPASPIELVRRHDHDRFLASLFMPAARRPAVWALLAFNLEIARVREAVSQPIIGQIRLQWWRDALDEIYTGKPPRRHEVVEPLAAAIEAHRLTRLHFDTLIDGREFDLGDEPPANLAVLERYLEKTSSRLIDLQLEILDVTAPAAFEAARSVGIAWGLVGLARALPFHAAQGRIYLPADLMAATGVERDALLAGKGSDAVKAVVRHLSDRASEHLAAASQLRRQIPREAIPALLSARTARAYRNRLARVDHDPFDRRLQAPDAGAVPRLALARYLGLV